MVIIAGCLGLRASEIVGLRWEDFDWETGTVNVCRSVVHGRVDEVKTEYSQDRLPLDETLIELVRHRREQLGRPEEGWLFPSSRTGRPYHQEEIQKKYLSVAGESAGVQGRVGWHTFRHSYRSWLAEVGTELEIQKGLMRHASISTTINIYGRTPDSGKRQAQSKVVQMLLPPKLAAVS